MRLSFLLSTLHTLLSLLSAYLHTVHNNYYFLRQLSQRLEKDITGAVVSECFSQSRNELIIRFETRQGPTFIRASLQPEFSCLSFPKEFHRARKNSVDLFSELIGRHVTSVYQHLNDRSFSIVMTEGFRLLFKMHGSKSNLILFQHDTIADVFRKKLKGDYGLKPFSLDRQIDWSYESFVSNTNSLQKMYFTFGKVIWNFLHDKGFENKTTDEKWSDIRQMLQALENPAFSLADLNDVMILTLVPVGKIVKTWSDPVEALNAFSLAYANTNALHTEKNKALAALRTKISGNRKYLEKTSEKLDQIKNDVHFKVWADLIMANLSAISAGQDAVTLRNIFDEDKEVIIKLKKNLSPQKNAELLYSKAKNQAIEIDYLQRSLQQKNEETRELETTLRLLETITDLKTLRNEIKSMTIESEVVLSKKTLPYHEFEYKGYRIWVGKSATGNDELTLKYGYKEDLWLHAKDVAGSHVLIKHQAGKKFPKDVIEKAASLAAYNSKRKNDSLCPVIVTPKKFVRKRKGDPPGLVVVEREEVVMVTPGLIR